MQIYTISLYDQKGIFLQYNGSAEKIGAIYQVCPTKLAYLGDLLMSHLALLQSRYPKH